MKSILIIGSLNYISYVYIVMFIIQSNIFDKLLFVHLDTCHHILMNAGINISLFVFNGLAKAGQSLEKEQASDNEKSGQDEVSGADKSKAPEENKD